MKGKVASKTFCTNFIREMEESLLLRVIFVSILLLVLALEIAQMNINVWADSWGAGCLYVGRFLLFRP